MFINSLLFSLEKVNEGILFSYKDKNASSVFLVGSMNEWNTSASPMTKKSDGIWEIILNLEAGKYTYKFLVDNDWYNDPDNFTGQFILSKIYLAMKNEKEAERILKNVVAKDSNNIEALILLIKLEKKLSRSINTIKKYIKDAYAKTPNNKFIKKEFKSLIQANKSNKKQKKATTSQVIVKPKTIIIDDAMATKTMYQLMKTQKKYDIAISILNRMKQKKNNEDFVVTEFDELRPLIKNKEF